MSDNLLPRALAELGRRHSRCHILVEMLGTDDAIERLIHTGADEAKLRAHARAHGAHSLRDDGLRLLAEGATSAEELLRVTRD